MRILLVLLVLFCIVIFVVGVFSPRRSRKVQRWYDRLLRKGERKGDRKAGKLGDMTEASIRGARKAGDASARAGRKTGEKLRP